MNTCPYCGAEQIDVKYPLYFDCGTIEPYHRTGACKVREPLWKELQAAKSRIESLVKVGDAIIENGSVSERLFNEWNKAKSNNS